MEGKRNLRKERIGIVLSNKMEKSIVVAVKRKVNTPFMVSSSTKLPGSLLMMLKIPAMKVIWFG